MQDLKISCTADLSETEIEVVERKGLGHPDTITDHLAEFLSQKYSLYTLEKFGGVLHHNFDKISLLGGAAFVQFGCGHIVKPIRVVLNGRASGSFGGKEIPLRNLLERWATEFLKGRLPLLRKTDISFIYEVSSESSPGRVDSKEGKEGPRARWFRPRDLDDLSERHCLRSNDTSAGVGHAPLTLLEKSIISLEKKLNSLAFHVKHPWAGSDIKVMGFRQGKEYAFTICVPQISRFVKDVEEYIKNKEYLRGVIESVLSKNGITNPMISLNTRDNESIPELYLTAIGTSLESGDEGVVGRGNRMNGLITLSHPMSMEGIAGKNPIYHIGKLYNIVADRIAKKIYIKTKKCVEVFLVSQSGRSLIDPWFTSVRVSGGLSATDRTLIQKIVQKEIKDIPRRSQELVKHFHPLA